MPLKTLVKVGNITNLSDARYCAGMGVEMLGFNTVPGRTGYITPASYQEIRGWVSGPQVVAEVYDLDKELFPGVIENYKPDFLELSVRDLVNLPTDSSLPLLLSFSEEDFQNARDHIDRRKQLIRYAVIKQSENDNIARFIAAVSKHFPVLLVPDDAADINHALSTLEIKGILLNGTSEIKPGLKDYGHLSGVLEQLDMD